MIRGGFWGGAWGLSWGGAWGEAWLLLNQPYQELSLKGQIFVRSYLTSIHSVEVVEQIVSVAAVNNISVIDAEVAVAAKVGETVLSLSSKSAERPTSQVSRGHPANRVSVRRQVLAVTAQPTIRVAHCEQAFHLINLANEQITPIYNG